MTTNHDEAGEPSREELAARIDELESRLDGDGTDNDKQDSSNDLGEAWGSTTRRGALAAVAAGLGVTSLAGSAAGQTSEQRDACTWIGNQNAAGYNLRNLGNLTFENDSTITTTSDGLKLDSLTLESLTTDSAVIKQRPTPSCDHTIFKHSGDYYAIDHQGAIVAGGDGNKNVTDSTDFAEVYAYVVNNNTEPAIRLPPGTYLAKTQQTLTEQHALWGAGRNRTYVVADSALQGQAVFIYNGDGAITRFDSIKFNAQSGGSLPDVYYKMTDSTAPPKELVITNCEFRDAQSWGIQYDCASGTMAFNSITNCWFLNGAGALLKGLTDLNFNNNKIHNSNTTVKIDSCSATSVDGNVFAQGANPITYTGTGFDTFDNTQIKAYPTSDMSFSSTTWADVPLDSTDRDPRGEVDTANNKITIDSTGWYWVSVQATFQVGSDGDRIFTRFRDVTNGTNLMRTDGETGGQIATTRGDSALVQLIEGNDYKLQVRNDNSGDTITGAKVWTHVSIIDTFR